MDQQPILKRPKPTDSEEELFRMQEEFLQNKQTPSAKVINLRANAKAEAMTTAPRTQFEKGKVKSRFSELKKQQRAQDIISTSQGTGNIVNPTAAEELASKATSKKIDAVHDTPPAVSNIVLGNIVEKKYDASKYNFDPKDKASLQCTGTGFPGVFVSDSMEKQKEHSIFWQHVSQTAHGKDEMVAKESLGLSCKMDSSSLIKGSWATEIHEENLKKLNEMTKEEILEAKQKLEMTLDPAIVQFLKNRRLVDKTSMESSIADKACNKNEDQVMRLGDQVVLEDEKQEESHSLSMDVDEENLQIAAKPPLEILQQAKEKGWINMNALEPEKLKWMEDIPQDSGSEQPLDKAYNARFDFNGLLLPYKDDSIPLEKGLHHHGDEPQRPGYSLQELLQLSRSSTQQQRCTALTTLANVMEKSRKGWYDKALQPAPLSALHERNILLLLRFSLDDTSVAIVTATLQALRAFLYSEADEVCLDRLYAFYNCEEPILIPPKNDVTDTSNLKDHELAQLDAVAALCRTDIVIRLRYILSEMRPPPLAVTCALEILIRLIRRSQVTAISIASTPHLLETIVSNFIPLSTDPLAMDDKINSAYGVPLTAAVRFCRVLVSYGGKSVAEQLVRLKVVQSIISYISCDAGKIGVNLGIESLRLWKSLLTHGVANDSISGAQLILVSQIRLLLSNHDIQSSSELACEYAAALMALSSYHTSLKADISVVLTKWNAQLHALSLPTWGITKLIARTVLAVRDTSAVEILDLSRTQVFSKLCSSSNLLSDCVPATNREPSSLPNLGVLTQEGQLQPAVSHHSCIPFLATVLKVFVETKSLAKIESILCHSEFCRYLKKLETSEWSLERYWYTRTELFLLSAVVRGASMLNSNLDNRITHVVWKIALKLVSALPADEPSDVKDMLRLALSKEKLNIELATKKLANLSLYSTAETVETTKFELNINYDVAHLYERYVTIKGDWDQAAMPKDWLYLPLVHIYTKCKNGSSSDDCDRTTILSVLSLELCLPDLVSELSATLRFSRLLLVYLCDTAYLSKDVSLLLTAAMRNLLKQYYKRLNFSADVPGLNSFTDLFTAMCEHFCSTSYGDNGFSMALLVPLAQRHDVHYRRLLWSEHAGSLRYIRLPIEQLVIPLKEYLHPIEQDASLIESYITALVRGTIREEWCPIPYKIAVHHSAVYLKQSTNLATRMRKQVEKLPNKDLAEILLNYDSSGTVA